MHSAVCATDGIISCDPGYGKALVIALALASGLLFSALLPAQSADDPEPAVPQVADDSFDAAGLHPGALTDLQRRLEAARAAMRDGRVNLPEDDSAWFFYRQIVDLYPENEEAWQGLANVQQHMLARAVGYAQELDFDGAERMLEHAASVLDEQTAVEHARTVINEIKSSRAGVLESQAIQLMDTGDYSAAERVLVDLIALGGQAGLVKILRERMKDVRIYGGFKAGQIIRDRFLNADFWTPDLVIIPAGSYSMGSTGKEKGRVENEGPYHRVTFQRGFAMGLREVSVAEFGAFVNATVFRTDADRSGGSTVYDAYSGRLTDKDGVYWEMNYEGKPAQPDDPVVHVSWNDAQAYVNWLARETGKSYRLPSEAEFEYALRAGSNSRYWWGSASPAAVVENISGEHDNSRAGRVWAVAFTAYGDRFWGPAPVASFESNPFGLFDMGGNVSEWVQDCWHETYVRAPLDGSAWVNPGCDLRVIRGGHWASLPDQTRAAYRRFGAANYHDARVGFRIARDL